VRETAPADANGGDGHQAGEQDADHQRSAPAANDKSGCVEHGLPMLCCFDPMQRILAATNKEMVYIPPFTVFIWQPL
jgi:hypothetical protein